MRMYQQPAAEKVKQAGDMQRRKRLRKRVERLCIRENVALVQPLRWCGGVLLDASGLVVLDKGERPSLSTLPDIRDRMRKREAAKAHRLVELERFAREHTVVRMPVTNYGYGQTGYTRSRW